MSTQFWHLQLYPILVSKVCLTHLRLHTQVGSKLNLIVQTTLQYLQTFFFIAASIPESSMPFVWEGTMEIGSAHYKPRKMAPISNDLVTNDFE